MNENFRIVHLKENPIAKRKRRTRRLRKGARRKIPRPTSSRRRRKHAPKSSSRGFVVEGLVQKGHRLHFVYWTGKSFSSKRRAAKTFRTEKEANKACHASMKRRAASYRLARVVSA